jgi:hypothetical protein
MQHGVLGLSINEHKVGFDVTVAMIFPVASQGMISLTRLKRKVVGQGVEDCLQVGLKSGAMLALGFALEVVFELRGWLNPPHEGFP